MTDKNDNLKPNVVALIPIMTIRPEFSTDSEQKFVQRNIIHTTWLNNNYKLLQDEIHDNIISRKGKGLFILYNNYHKWISLDDFKKKSLPEENMKNIVEMIEWTKPTSIILFFCEDDAMTLYHI